MSQTSVTAAPVKLEASAESWFTCSKLLILLAAFVVVRFPTALLGTEAFFYRDMGLFGYPLAQFHRDAFWHGEIPLWNPLNHCGLPFLAQWNTLSFYPGSLIYLLLPLPWSMNIFVLAHLFLAAAGMHALALRWTGNYFAASIGALAFALNGLTLHALMWPNNIAALGWMPWVVLAVERAWKEGRRHLVFGSLIGAMQMLTGAPEIILFTWVIIGVLWWRELWKREVTSAKLILRVTACAALVFALCAVQLFPFLELLLHSNRDAAYGNSRWSMPIWGWGNFLVPLLGCTSSPLGVVSQDTQQWTSSYFLGIGPIAFTMLALRRRVPRAKWLAALALAGLVLALGHDAYVYARLQEIFSALGFVRFPIKFVVLAIFTLPLLAAIGINTWQQTEVKRAERQLFWIVGLLLAAVLLIALLASLYPVKGTVAGPVVESALFRLCCWLPMAALLWVSREQSLIHRRYSLGLVLILMVMDVGWHMPRQNPLVSARTYGPLKLEMSKIPKPGEGRAMVSPSMRRELLFLSAPTPNELFLNHRRMLFLDANLLAGVPQVDGFFSLDLREPERVKRRLYSLANYDVPLLDFLAVTQISGEGESFSWRERPTAMPWVTGGQKPVCALPSDTFMDIFSPQFDPRQVVYLPPEAKAASEQVRPGQCRIISTRIERESVMVEAQADAPSLVVVSQAHAPAWRAYINGKPTTLWRANYAFQAIVVPSGQNHVTLRYEDRWFRGGAWLSSISLIGWVILLVRLRDKTAAALS